jgi:hypothetical protein
VKREDSRMKPTAAPPTQEALAGLVERVTFHNAENGFCVLRTKARGHRDLVTVVGHSARVRGHAAVKASPLAKPAGPRDQKQARPADDR